MSGREMVTFTFPDRAGITQLGWVTSPGNAISFKEILRGQSGSLGLMPSLPHFPPLLVEGSTLCFLGSWSAGTFGDRPT
jgi:hypothetical protein